MTTQRRAVGPQIIDWDRSHPLLASVELGNVDIADSLVLDPPPGATVLIDSTAGPIAAIARATPIRTRAGIRNRRPGQGRATNGEHQLAAAAELSDVLAQRARISGRRHRGFANRVRRGRAGRSSLRTAGNVPELTVVDPTGKEYTVKRTAEDVFQFHDTNSLGVYECGGATR